MNKNKLLSILILTILLPKLFVKSECYKVLEIDSLSFEKSNFIKLKELSRNKYLYIASEKLNQDSINKYSNLELLKIDSCYTDLELTGISNITELFKLGDIILDHRTENVSGSYYNFLTFSNANYSARKILDTCNRIGYFSNHPGDTFSTSRFDLKDTLIYFYKSNRIVDKFIRRKD